MAKEQWHNVHTCFNTCALTGAAAFFAGIEEAVIVGNGPLWCYFYALKSLEAACPDIGSRFFCSQVDNQSVVYGTEESLLATLQRVKETTRPSVLLIENSCSVSLIGDDIAAIARQASLPCPVVCLDSGGLTGGFQAGYQAAAEAYFSAVRLPAGLPPRPRAVNLLGATTCYYNAASDLRELKRLLAAAGYEVLACPGAGASQTDIAAMSQAELNIVIHAELGQDAARLLAEQYGTPYVSMLPPYGLAGTWEWLQAIGRASGRPKQDFAAVGRELDLLERRLRSATMELERMWGELWFERIVVSGPSSTALGLSQAVRNEWVDTASLTAIAQDGTSYHHLPAGIDQVIDGGKDSLLIGRCLDELKAGLLLASSNESAWLERQGIQAVVCRNIALPVYDEMLISDRPFMGLKGAAYFIEQLWEQHIAICRLQARSNHAEG